MIVSDASAGNGINFNVQTNVTTTIGDGKVETIGFRVTYSEGAAIVAQVGGTWAVTG
jgi:hypothetical protein